MIAAARRRCELTQGQVADGCPGRRVSRVEQGKQRAWVGYVLRLACFLDVELYGSLPEVDQIHKQALPSEYPDINKIMD